MRKICYLFCFISLFVAYGDKNKEKVSGVDSVSQKSLQVVLATLEWPPYTSKNLPKQGFLTELVLEIFKSENVNADVKFLTWNRVLRDVKEGYADAMFPAYLTEQRTKVYHMSEAFAESKLVLFARPELSSTYESLIEHKGKSIGVVRGYVNSPEFDRADFLTKKVANSDDLNLKKLLNHRLDMAVCDLYTGRYLLSKIEADKKKWPQVLNPPLQIKGLHLGVSRKSKHQKRLVKAFSNGLKRLRNTGRLKEIFLQHGML